MHQEEQWTPNRLSLPEEASADSPWRWVSRARDVVWGSWNARRRWPHGDRWLGVQGRAEGGGRWRAEGVGAHDVPLGDPDRAHAPEAALECRDAVGGAQVPRRALSAVGMESVQSRRHLSQRRRR